MIPNITYANDNYFDVMLDGMENVEVVAFSVKGSIKEKVEREFLIKAIKYSVDNINNLKKINIYSVAINEGIILSLFEYASSRDIEIIIPNNI